MTTPGTIESVTEHLTAAAKNPSETAGEKVLEEVNAYLKSAGNDATKRAQNVAAVNKLFGELKFDMDGDGSGEDERIELKDDTLVVKHKDDKTGQEVEYGGAREAFSGKFRMLDRTGANGVIDGTVSNIVGGLQDKPPKGSKLEVTQDGRSFVGGPNIKPLDGFYGADKPSWRRNDTSGKWYETTNGQEIEVAAVKFAPNGDVHVLHFNGHVDVRSEDGTIKKLDGKGDLRELYPGKNYANDGTYYKKENGQWVEYQQGKPPAVPVKDVSMRPNGDIVVRYPDGRSEVRNKDGEIFKYDKEGKVQEVYSKHIKPSGQWKSGGSEELDPQIAKRAEQSAPQRSGKGNDGKNKPADDGKKTENGEAGKNKPAGNKDKKPVEGTEELGRHKIKVETNKEGERTAVVKKGDTLWWIAQEQIKKDKSDPNYKPSPKEVWAMVEKIKSLNKDIKDNYVIHPGQRIKLPGKDDAAKPTNGGGRSGEGQRRGGEGGGDAKNNEERKDGRQQRKELTPEQIKQMRLSMFKRMAGEDGKISKAELDRAIAGATEKLDKLPEGPRKTLEKVKTQLEKLNSSFKDHARDDNLISEDEWNAFFENTDKQEEKAQQTDGAKPTVKQGQEVASALRSYFDTMNTDKNDRVTQQEITEFLSKAKLSDEDKAALTTALKTIGRIEQLEDGTPEEEQPGITVKDLEVLERYVGITPGKTNEKTGAPVKNYGVVTEGRIYRGGQPLGDDYKYLKEQGIKTIIDLSDDKMYESEKERAEANGFKYIHIPIYDSHATPDDQTVNKIIEAMKDESNGKMFIHCQAGKHRTGAMVAIYKMMHENMSYKDAVEEMKKYGFDPPEVERTKEGKNGVAEHELLWKYVEAAARKLNRI